MLNVLGNDRLKLPKALATIANLNHLATTEARIGMRSPIRKQNRIHKTLDLKKSSQIWAYLGGRHGVVDGFDVDAAGDDELDDDDAKKTLRN